MLNPVEEDMEETIKSLENYQKDVNAERNEIISLENNKDKSKNIDNNNQLIKIEKSNFIKKYIKKKNNKESNIKEQLEEALITSNHVNKRDKSLNRKIENSKADNRSQLSSSSDESIILIAHHGYSSNPQCIFSTSQRQETHENIEASTNDKNMLQRFKKYPDALVPFVVGPMIGPQLPHAGFDKGMNACLQINLTGFESVGEKTRRMRRNVLKKEVEEMVAEKMKLEKTMMQRRFEMLEGNKMIRECKEKLENKVGEVRLLSVECIRSVSKTLEVMDRLRNMPGFYNIDK